MAFRDLVEGDCGGASSLAHLASHYVQDHGFKEEGIRQPFSPPEASQPPNADQMVQQFLEEPACPQTFRMDGLLQEMREIDQNVACPKGLALAQGLKNDINQIFATNYKNIPPNALEAIDKAVAEEMRHCVEGDMKKISELGLNPKWAEDFLECNTAQDDARSETIRCEKDDPNIAYSKFMKFMHQESDDPERQVALSKMPQEWIEQIHDDFSKDVRRCLLTHEEWVDLYNREIIEDVKKVKKSLLRDEEWVVHFNAAMEEDDLNALRRSLVNDDNVLNKVEEELEVAGTWVDEFTKKNPVAEDNIESLWKRFQNEWDKVSADGLSSAHPWVSEFDTYYDPFNKEYDFSETNPMKDLPNALAEGKRRLEAGDLPSAVLCFEAAAQQDENSIEAWLLLGKTQAENEQDPLAISALNRCLCLDPSNSVALMALAASYANESYQKQACLTLKEWLLKNEKYKHLAGPESNLKKEEHPNLSVSTLLYDKVYDEVKDLYIQAARINPTDEIDADVQCGLGILFNLSNDYNKAVDCFQAALHVRPDDSRLWNRLGATLANGQRSAEAVNAYHRALELSPGFIRARYNLGISCVNLGAYKEAGEHLLTALNQQAAGRGPEASSVPPKAMSNTIWSTLRLVISLMHKYELMEAIENRDLPKLNKEFEIM
ncbi:PREDICTED: peroxisomal targeting signal 1 receptor [Vollenhovia emeryi]|uniref:peroxisomal targeting signal 1 receptor n=1 Tax=Vollenhovia emeryi TaxID=411798 RepID=UPI0005F4E244|nr:PREDICTED: peroxisomal targeting signal 1 receptor [Vollenhovia emeryi]XP_011872331.1 PREDICTED: peroxisomal targeting signal 1 receptor [Vollenhovia emeryi]